MLFRSPAVKVPVPTATVLGAVLLGAAIIIPLGTVNVLVLLIVIPLLLEGDSKLIASAAAVVFTVMTTPEGITTESLEVGIVPPGQGALAVVEFQFPVATAVIVADWAVDAENKSRMNSPSIIAFEKNFPKRQFVNSWMVFLLFIVGLSILFLSEEIITWVGSEALFCSIFEAVKVFISF